MTKYRKLPVIIDAIEFTYEHKDLALNFMIGNGYPETDEEGNPTLRIYTREGAMIATLGDFIIRGVIGEYYPCKPDIFKATYEIAKGAG